MEHLTPSQKQLYDWLIEYITTNKHSPSIREMMKGMNLRSPAPIQSRLEKMRTKGYINWSEGQARTLKILRNEEGLSLLGKITSGGLIETFAEKPEKINVNDLFNQLNCYVLQVVGDSMSQEKIANGDYLVMESVSYVGEVKEGDLVAVKVETEGMMLKRISIQSDKVMLMALNSNDESISFVQDEVEIQGVLRGVFRLFNS